MPEDQNTEWKEIWQDKYLEEICGFANADGGKLYVGINDKGDVVGLDNSKKWSEYIPDKINTMLNILVEVNLYSEDDKEYIEIVVHPSSSKISYKGVYYYRIGSTNRQLSGSALTDFLKNPEERWENGLVNDITVEDLDEESFRIFRKEARRNQRLSEANLNLSNRELLQSLNLMEGDRLKRSAVLLFHGNPQILGSGISVRIGKFERGEVTHHDVLEGSLISTAHTIVDLIYLKFLKAKISYENDRRVETYPYDREALREAIFNALIHNRYEAGIHIQIRIEEERLIISNSCSLPSDWTVETLLSFHKSIPHNPDIANVFYRARFIENRGQGIQKICRCCQNFGAEAPIFQISAGDISVFFTALKTAVIRDDENAVKPTKDTTGKTDMRRGGDETKSEQSNNTKMLLDEIRNDPYVTREKLSEKLNVTVRQIQRKLDDLKKSGKITRVGGKKYGHWQING
ncbi:MAG: putative DNA binding domain-containing protein [Clostridia bacterium]|nr:putative DNA binding domain-containing protein [Clostridia bacterium]